MKINTLAKFVILTTFAAAGAVFAQETAEAAPAPTSAQLEENVNTIGETIRLKIERFNHVRMKLAQSQNDPDFTSESVEAKRREIKELQNAIIKAQIELREEIATLPAAKALADETEKLSKEIRELRDQKEAETYKMRVTRLEEAAAKHDTAEQNAAEQNAGEQNTGETD